LRAVALGYEMTIRFASALGAAMTFKQSSLASHAYGPLFGAGYAAGSLMRFDEERFRILLNYLAQEASGLTTWRLDERHALKSYVFAGMPAANGVKACALVRAGFSGGGDVLNRADRNMLDAISPSPREDELTDGLGEAFRILGTDIKCYPVGYPIAAPVAALERIIAMSGFDGERVRDVRVYYDEDWYKVVGDQTQLPDVNLRYCLAVTLLDGRLTFGAAHDADRMRSPALRALGSRIRLLPPKPHLDRFAVRVEADVGGTCFAAEQGRSVLGRAENPMSADQVREKAFDLLTTVLTADSSREVIDLVARIEELPDVAPLIAAMIPR
jgi:2-methylcitrate dehydratase PrpD